MIKRSPNINVPKVKESPLFWPARLKGDILFVLDETLIPKKLHYIKVKNAKEAVQVIKQMKTRAFGQFLVVLNAFLLDINNSKKMSEHALVKRLEKTAKALNNSRPTFPFAEVTGVILHWAHEALKKETDLREYVSRNIFGYLGNIKAKRLERVGRIAKLIKNGDSILTHCNVSGELAMAAYICRQEKKKTHFFATETRPYLQGTKLTSWELERMGAKVTVIADNAIGSVMSDGLVNKVIVGSDRSCANGDIANKIGTYQIAVLAKEFGVPFYVLTQPSDKIKKGEHIPIEIRNANELLSGIRKKVIGRMVKGFYPGFDVVPNKLITKSIPINVN